MTVRVIAAALLLVIVDCSALDRLRGVGRLHLDQTGTSRRRVALTVPVDAHYCAADSTLRIVGASGTWSAAVALKTAWPAVQRAFAIDSVVRGPGGAAVAARPIGDSIGVALTALSGSLTLTGSTKVAGTLDLVAAGGRDTVHLLGGFDVPAPAVGGCPPP